MNTSASRELERKLRLLAEAIRRGDRVAELNLRNIIRRARVSITD